MRYLSPYEMDSPYDNEEYFSRQRMHEIIYELDLDPECNYTYEEILELIGADDE